MAQSVRGTRASWTERLGVSGWVGVAVLAVVAFVAAAFELVRLSPFLGIAAAALCGALAYFAIDSAYWLRQAELRRGPGRPPPGGRAHEVSLAPSFEVYDPRRAAPEPRELPPPEE